MIALNVPLSIHTAGSARVIRAALPERCYQCGADHSFEKIGADRSADVYRCICDAVEYVTRAD